MTMLIQSDKFNI